MEGRMGKMFVGVALAKLLSGSFEGEALAEHDRRGIERRQGRIEANGSDVFYVGKKPKKVEVEGKEGTETAAIIRVQNEGDPKVKGDEYIIDGRWYQAKIGRETTLRFKMDTKGDFSGAKVIPSRTSRGRRESSPGARTAALQRWQLGQLKAGLKAVGKDGSFAAADLDKRLGGGKEKSSQKSSSSGSGMPAANPGDIPGSSFK